MIFASPTTASSLREEKNLSSLCLTTAKQPSEHSRHPAKDIALTTAGWDFRLATPWVFLLVVCPTEMVIHYLWRASQFKPELYTYEVTHYEPLFRKLGLTILDCRPLPALHRPLKDVRRALSAAASRSSGGSCSWPASLTGNYS